LIRDGVGGARLGQLDAVTALPLGHVQSRVGEALEPVQGARMSGVAGHAHRGRDRRVAAREGDVRDRRADPLGDLQCDGDLGVGQQDRELLPALAAGEVLVPQHGAQRRADAGQDLVAHRVPMLVVDLLEVVEVDHEQRERRLGRCGLGERPLQCVGDRALVGQPGQAVGGGADLGHGQVAQVGQHRRRLADRLADPLLLRLRIAGWAAEQDRADHFAPDRERDARRGPWNGGAERAGQEARPPAAFAMRPARPDRQARARLRAAQGPGQRRAARQGRDRLQPVRAVVPVEHHGRGGRQRALEEALQEPVRLVLVVGELQGLLELRLVLAGLQVPADAADPEPQEPGTNRDAEDPDAEQQADGAARAGRGLQVVGVRVVHFREDQPVQVRTDRLVGSGQLGGERPGGRSGEVGQAEQVTDGGPLPDEELEASPLGRRVAGVQLFQRRQLGVDRGQQAGVQRTKQAGPRCGLGGQGGLFPGGVRGVHGPAQLAGRDGGGQLVARDRVAPVHGRFGTHDADGAHRDHRQHEHDEQCHERSGGGSSQSLHSSVLTRGPAWKNSR
jgi:hypothetical protein